MENSGKIDIHAILAFLSNLNSCDCFINIKDTIYDIAYKTILFAIFTVLKKYKYLFCKKNYKYLPVLRKSCKLLCPMSGQHKYF